MLDINFTGKKAFFFRLSITLGLALFFTFCLLHKLSADFTSGDYAKLLTRFSLVFLLSILLTYRLKSLCIEKKEDWFHIALVGVFLAALFYPVISQTSFLRKGAEQTQKIILKQHNSKHPATVALINKFPSTFQKVFSDSFIFPSWYIKLEALVKVYGLGISPNSNVAVGKNGFYFEGWGARKVEKGIVEKFDNIADYMGQIPLTQQELKQWRRTLEERAYWLKEHGSEYVFVLAPTKALVYPEYLPDSLQNVIDQGRITRYQQLTTYLQNKSNIHFIDLLPHLLEAKKQRDYPLLFYKTDFHWNYYGAFIAYQTIIDRFAKIFPQYNWSHPDFADFTMQIDQHWAHHRFMRMIGLPASLLKNEHYITMVPKPDGRWDGSKDLPEKGIYDFYPPTRKITESNGSSINISLVRNPDAPVPSLLLLGDSFLEKCVYYFSADAKEVFNQRTIVNFPDNLFNYIQPSIVLQEVLNMFILRPPPQNPPGFKASYLRGKFNDNADSVALFTSDFDALPSGWQGNLAATDIDPEKQVFAQLTVHVKTKTKLTIIMDSDTDGVTYHRSLQAGENQLYFELPAEKFHKIRLKTDKTTKDYVPISFEIRTCK